MFRRHTSRSSAARYWVPKAIVGVAAWLLCAAPSLAAHGGEAMFKGQIIRGQLAYVLSDPVNKVVYQLDNQTIPTAFAAQNVIVVGVLDRSSGTIHVDDIVRDLPAKIRQAKSVAIVCDACPRDMAKARKAAFVQMLDWNRFTLEPDPQKADLVILFSANPYLGDYVTRDGPDKRLVAVVTTYMNVIDPHTGENLWGDSQRAGAWYVASATRDLIRAFREQLEMDENPVELHAFVERHLVPRLPYQGK
jgi:hypothetical protein